MDDLITAAETARLLHLNVKRVQHLARAGKLPALRFGHKWLFSRALLLAPHAPPVQDAQDAQDSHVAPDTEAGEIEEPIEISARNRLRGTITSVAADGVMAEIRLRVGDQEIVSVITRSSAERLRLKAGDAVFAVMKSTEVMIAKGGRTTQARGDVL